ncbi:DUF2750 domain-containing protein [Sinorhizobium meliloti]|uniref:DUF2750 domain-containing protein n=1 Tax=Rhizobium meliloti TaxID=382 RepID=UPI001294CF94|nr:DUF2750 domain-containing protein [Sinorhizobium meliloti]MDW9517279.1 DUF2750 domain-containing protein [Sinorhizobium meliloti]MDX0113368.1 DUF2750 domain-containing protein [Sinorhizobium meliloti]MQX24964.1 DUF2750 domain-containing protein [Sinorhizobium meliloti]
MKISPRQVEAVLASPGVRRFEHFIKVVADWQEVWGLYRDGWALAVSDDGITVFPLWPAKEYAQLCALNEWKGFEPRAISLTDFTDVLLPKLKVEGVLPGVFFTPTSKGVTPPVDELRAALEAELQNY